MLPYPLDLIGKLSLPGDSRILLVVLDGVGDIPVDGATPLSAARTPRLDELARESSLGLSTSVAPGITPGSGPGHLSLFGYDPLVFDVGRGVLSALGIGLDLGEDQVAARGNFATLAADGTIADRRAGRIPTALNQELVTELQRGLDRIDGVKVELFTEAEYRFVLVLTGEGLGGGVGETDPGRVGVEPLAPEALSDSAEDRRTSAVLQSLVARLSDGLREIALARESDPAVNTVLLRGIGRRPQIQPMSEIFRLRAGAVAAYPMYRGVARLVGMACVPMSLEGTGERTTNKLEAYAAHAAEYDLVYFHVKKTDSWGEDGDFDKKTAEIDAFDGIVPDLLAQEPDVVVLTGDHSTPVPLKAHSWHSLPVLLWSRYGRPDGGRFTEASCRTGSLGRLRHLDLMPLAMAHARRLQKFGA